MRIGNKHYRSIWLDEEPGVVKVIDQRKLPFQLEELSLRTARDAHHAISDMAVRGAPLIGVTAAFGLWLAARESTGSEWCMQIRDAASTLASARPTAVNLSHAIGWGIRELDCTASKERAVEILFHLAVNLSENEVDRCRRIGDHGLELIREIHRKTGNSVRILTHCNAGWLACVDYGTATAPIYRAHDEGLPVHVWVDETRPRNQGSRLTAFELGEHGVPHTLIADNAGGHLMQQGEVDLVLVGSDRTTASGDVANKIGTYLKALAAKDNQVPFFVALPTSSIDLTLHDGARIEIENRTGDEVTFVEGWDETTQKVVRVRTGPAGSPVANPGFDVTPSRLVTGLVTELGICEASGAGIKSLFTS